MENNQNAKVFGQGELEIDLVGDREGQQNSQAEIQGYHTGYSSPREYLHNFLLQAQSAGANVGSYIDEEIKLLLAELKR